MNMSQLDFLAGQRAARRTADAQERIDDDAIAQWQSFSNRLQARLSEVQSDTIHIKALLAARDAQQRALRDILSEIAPNHPILKRIKEIGETAQAASYRASGYQIDPTTNTVRKILNK